MSNPFVSLSAQHLPVLDFEKVLKFIWDNPGVHFSWDYFDYTNRVLTDALVKGWKTRNEHLHLASYYNLAEGDGLENFADIHISYGGEDRLTAQMMEVNLFEFSASKTLDMANRINAHLKTSNTYSDFEKRVYADPHIGAYNNNYLQTEYNFAWSVAQNAANYHRMLSVKDIYPTWIYRTQGDSRVREAHQVLEGRQFKAGDVNAIYPPNGWGCRCYIEPSTATPQQYDSETDAEASLGDEFLNMKRDGFAINRAKVNEIFANNQMYVNDVLQQKTGIKDNGILPYNKLDQNQYPVLDLKERSADWAKEWLTTNTKDGYLKDYTGRELKFSLQLASKHLEGDYIKEGISGRQNTIEFIPEIINKPDEVWFFKDNKNKDLKLRYLKYYKDTPMNVVATIHPEYKIDSWYEIDVNKIDRHMRTGFIIKKNSL